MIEYPTAGKVEEKVAADEAIDVAILTKPGADKLVRAAKLVGGTTTVPSKRRYAYLDDNRYAVERLAAIIDRILDPDAAVVPLRRA